MKRPLISLLIFFYVVWSVIGSAQTKRDDKKLIEDARNVYSTLRRQGLVEVRAALSPNWQPVFRELPAARKPSAMKLANRLRFSIVVDSNGKIEVAHRILGPKPDRPTAEALDLLAKGVELSATGFLMSWSPFMMTSLIPEQLDKFVLQEQETEYLLSFTQSGIDVSVVMKKDLLITELKTSQGSVRPMLTRTNDGFVLTGYEANNTDPVVGTVSLKARIESIPVNGMTLPQRVFLDGTSGGVPFKFELLFTNYRLKTAPKVSTTTR
jgi:hypothetical protein